ncbi:MAG: YkgJ family cysteine cluster protein [Xanthomonadaceae bacterium]|nr:YkgJ family cysteine cluster protein [Xanthomonadaceae bacterium]
MTIPLAAPRPERSEPAAAVLCETCEAVCCRLTVVLMPEDRPPAWLTEHDERGLHIMAKDEDGRCRAVDPRSLLCTIYERRPQACRKFAMGGPYCRSEREAWFGASDRAIPVTLC